MVMISEIANNEEVKLDEEDSLKNCDGPGDQEVEEAQKSEEKPGEPEETPPVDPGDETLDQTPTTVAVSDSALPPPPPPPPPPLPPSPPLPPPVVDPGSAGGKTFYNEYALRVAYIMRNYIHMSHINAATATSNGAASGGDSPVEGCGAVMEVIRTTTGRWAVARFVVEHTHTLSPPVDPAGTLAGVIPVVGMEFESISMAKALYQTYSEKMGFKCKTGAGRRSRDNRTLVMQRFYCSKGSYPPSKRQQPDPEEVERKQRMMHMPYRKIAPKPLKEGDLVVIPDENPKEGTLVAEGNDCSAGEDVGLVEKEGDVEEKDSVKKPGEREGDHKKHKEGGKVPLVSNPGQSRLLRELGIRVSRYSHEERRDIISKYMKKRNGRQAVDRSIKIPSRQALAERRQRGIGGKFLSKEELETQPSNRQEETTEDEAEVSAEDIVKAGGVPIVGMVFDNEDKAYEYYVNYAGNVGFSVRKGWWDKSSKNITRSRVYVCSREGFRPKSVENEGKRSRPETRTGCPARMAIKITSNNKYRVTEFVPDHNHQLAAPLDIQLLRSQKLPVKAQPGCESSNLIPTGYKNYVRSNRMKEMRRGDAGAVLAYLQKMKGDNPSFYYAIQVDEDDQMTNVFWADAKSIVDYHYFGDVICFDTSYKMNEYGRPFALFLGVNHHKQVIIFGAALLYDESLESFKWLFETFKMAMCGKNPKTILLEQCAAVMDAVTAVWSGTVQRLCLWHLYQNVIKLLNYTVQDSETFAHDFSQCLYDFEEEDEFVSAWNMMLDKYDLKDNEWLAKLYSEKEKWASVYGRGAFCGDMEYTLRGENLKDVLKEHLSLEKDLSSFFKEYEKLLDERRCAEIEADYHANQTTQRIPPLQLLWQTASAYTPAAFDMFRREFDLFMNCVVFIRVEVGTLSQYEVTVREKTKGHIVRFDSSNVSVTCSCNKFKYVGIQCCHVLKVLDLKNIKELPPQFILKRWRKDAKVENMRENHEFGLDGDLSSSVSQRYSSLCRILYKIAARASENSEAFALMVNHSDQVLEQVETILQTALVEKTLPPNNSKAQPQKVVGSANFSHDSNENQRISGRKKKEGVVRRRPHGVLEPNKRQKGQNGQSNELETSTIDVEQPVTLDSIPLQPRIPSNQFLTSSHFMQAPYVPGHHQFGLGTTQGFHAMTQFNQDTSAVALQQQPFHGGAHLNQDSSLSQIVLSELTKATDLIGVSVMTAVQPFPTPDMHSLQFVAGNPQLDHQTGDQGHCAVPVWDFL
ncbi:FHY3/FAR1 family protein [Dioscorea alata]|uniref:FHY3/FAR1 family protein n=1 Tax=Dioscorea alata TaxID=55571 RepID=A0ACB7U2B2_DIOAL|nr:FHY3/FAR1 family protein [Dioscorea alata]